MLGRFSRRTRQPAPAKELPDLLPFAGHLAATYGAERPLWLEEGSTAPDETDAVVADLRGRVGRAERAALDKLRRVMSRAAAGVVVGEGPLERLEERMRQAGLAVSFSGFTAEGDRREKSLPLAVVANEAARRLGRHPAISV